MRVALCAIAITPPLLLLCCSQSKSTPTPLPDKVIAATVLSDGDDKPLSQDEVSTTFNTGILFHPDFDGSSKDLWVLNPAALCLDNVARAIIVDVDKTAVEGNFLQQVTVREQARATLHALDKKYGVIFLTANFVIDRVATFFATHAYPERAPLVARPRNYWGKDYTEWCRQGTAYELCETAYKTDRIEYMRSRCAQVPARSVGLGDKFSDYHAYRMAGLCPIIVSEGDVDEVNTSEQQRGCREDAMHLYAWSESRSGLGERCTVVPKRFIVPWSKVEDIVERYLAGAVACGEW